MMKTELTEDVLSHQQTLALQALLEGSTVTDAAEAAGVHINSVSRWKNHDPAFRSALRSARSTALEAGLSVLQREAANLARTLVNIATDEQAGKRDRVSAASTGLRLALQMAESDEVDRKIDELEAMLGQIDDAS